LGKIFTPKELKQIADVCVENNILIISDEVYDRLFYVPFTRIATMSPEVERITLTLSSAGKNFYATGWRVGKIFHDVQPNKASFKLTESTGWVMGPSELVSYVTKAHARICYCSPSPLQEAFAIGRFEA
jgi:kynurenine aminotransferase